jgi:hypothetical protein
MNSRPEALVHLGLAPAALGGRANGHGSTLVVPVLRVVGELSFFPNLRIRRALALLDLAHRNFLAVRDLGPLVPTGNSTADVIPRIG